MFRLGVKDFYGLSEDAIEAAGLKEKEEYLLINGYIKSRAGFSKSLTGVIIDILAKGHCVKLMPGSSTNSITLLVDTKIGNFRERL